MKFLVDAHLPRRLVRLLRDVGHDALHTLDLSRGNRTTDREINTISLRDQRVVVTKDSDFVNSLVLHSQPWKLLLISTGNISNRELEQLITANLSAIVRGFQDCDYIEVSRTHLILHI
jgi:predicted nuclease of predicted toxin-antitoxin system